MKMAANVIIVCLCFGSGMHAQEIAQIMPGDTDALLAALHAARDRVPPFRVVTDVVHQPAAEPVNLDQAPEQQLAWRPLAQQDWPAPVRIGTSRWQVDGDRFRVEDDREIEPAASRVYAFDGQQFSFLKSMGNSPGASGGFRKKPFSIGHSNPLVFCFVNGNMTSVVWPATVEEELFRVTSDAAFEDIRGHATLKLTVEVKQTSKPLRQFWLARDLGWTPIRIQQNNELGQRIAEYDAIELAELAPDVWIPTLGKMTVYGISAADSEERIVTGIHTVTVQPGSLALEPGLLPDELAIAMPPGTLVQDEIENRIYMVGESHEKLLEEELEHIQEQAKADPAIKLHDDSKVAVANPEGSPVVADGTVSTQVAVADKACSLRKWGIAGFIGVAGFFAMLLLLQRLHSSTTHRVGHPEQ